MWFNSCLSNSWLMQSWNCFSPFASLDRMCQKVCYSCSSHRHYYFLNATNSSRRLLHRSLERNCYQWELHCFFLDSLCSVSLPENFVKNYCLYFDCMLAVASSFGLCYYFLHRNLCQCCYSSLDHCFLRLMHFQIQPHLDFLILLCSSFWV